MQKIWCLMANKVIIAGASGLIGSNLLQITLAEPNYDEVLILVRKELPLSNPKLKQLIVDFEQPGTYSAAITGHALFCCLGSTKKKTPNLNDYRKIDHDYPLLLAQMALQNGVAQYHVVSSIGADPKSSFYYTKIKGDMEKDIKSAGLKNLHIYEPATLTGNRNEHRPLENMMVPIIKIFDPLLIGPLKKYRTIPAKTVALAMYNQSLKKEDGLFIYPSNIIKQLA